MCRQIITIKPQLHAASNSICSLSYLLDQLIVCNLVMVHHQSKCRTLVSKPGHMLQADPLKQTLLLLRHQSSKLWPPPLQKRWQLLVALQQVASLKVTSFGVWSAEELCQQVDKHKWLLDMHEDSSHCALPWGLTYNTCTKPQANCVKIKKPLH